MAEKILVVDDQEIMLRLLSQPLQSAGFVVVTAKTASEGLTQLQTEQPDLLILDVMLPDASGIDICQHIRQTMQLTDLPIIILSGLTGLASKIQGLEAGADEYVTKPVDPQEMVVRVRSMLTRTQRLRQSATPETKHGCLIGMIGAKGGVGTTTVTLNVATTLSQRSMRVVAVELRPYFGTMARQLNISPAVTLGQVMEMVPRSITKSRVNEHLIKIDSRLRVLVGPQKIKEYREMQPGQIDALLMALTQMADYTVIDLPHMPSVANRSALRSCNLICVVLEPEPGGVAAAQALLELLAAWGISRNVLRAIIVNRQQSSNVLSVEEIKQALQIEVAGAITAAVEHTVRAVATGVPLVRSAPDALVSSTLVELAERLAGQLAGIPA